MESLFLLIFFSVRVVITYWVSYPQPPWALKTKGVKEPCSTCITRWLYVIFFSFSTFPIFKLFQFSEHWEIALTFCDFNFYPLATFLQIFMHIYQSDQKLWTFYHIYPDVFKYFQFFTDVSIVLYSLFQLFYFYCIMLHSVCLLSEKKRSTTRVIIHDWLFLPNFHISKKFLVTAIFMKTSW